MDHNKFHFLKGYSNPSKKIPKFLLSNLLWNKSYLDILGEKYLDESEILIKSNIKLTEDFTCDFTINYIGVIPQINKLLGHKGWVRFNDVFQRKHVELMKRNEYKEFIIDPYKFISEKALLRLYDKYDDRENIKTAYEIYNEKVSSYFTAQNTLQNKYSIDNKYLDVLSAPLDVFGDFLRGTKNILLDLHNCPDLVNEAAHSIVELLYEKAIINRRLNHNSWLVMPLHLPGILSVSDFNNFFYPSFKILLDKLLSENFIILVFLEGNTERLLDKIFEIDSPNVIFNFEEDIPNMVSKKMNHTNNVSGFFPVHLLKYGSDNECIAYASKLLKIFEGKNYIFSTNRVLYTPSDVDIHKLKLVYHYVNEY